MDFIETDPFKDGWNQRTALLGDKRLAVPVILGRLWPMISVAPLGKQKAIERSLRYFMRRSREVSAQENGSCSTS